MFNCCEYLPKYFNDPREPLHYNSYFREYSIRKTKRRVLQRVLLLDFCPWCGSELPKSLRREYFDILRNEMHLDIYLEEVINRSELIPPEFFTDEWWKKRGL
jgi:hypothetical protein